MSFLVDDSDEEVEDSLAEMAPTSPTPEQLHIKYFRGHLEYAPHCRGHLEYAPDIGQNLKHIDWKEFLKDLEETPEFARHECGFGSYSPLQYVILVPDIPLEVIKTLLRLNPTAVDDREADHDWNTLNWLTIFYRPSLEDISPEILRLLVERKPNMPLEETDDPYGGTLMDLFLDYGVPKQAMAILEVSPESVSHVLSRHYDGQQTLSRRLLTVALNSARKFETDFEGNSDSIFCDFGAVDMDTTRRLVDTLFMDLDGGDTKKVALFHRYLKLFVSARRKRQWIDIDSRNPPIDEDSLSCCVIYLLANLADSPNYGTYERDYDIDDEESRAAIRENKADLWDKFVEQCPNHLKREGTMALRTALESGFQWDPVLRDIGSQCPDIFLSRHPDENMPAFMVAAASNKTQCQMLGSELGKSFPQHYGDEARNTIQNTYLLLRANPAMILPSASAPTKKVDQKRKAATKKPARRKKKSKS